VPAIMKGLLQLHLYLLFSGNTLIFFPDEPLEMRWENIYFQTKNYF